MQGIEVFNALLTQSAAVTALVGSRVYPVELPQAIALPAIAIEAASDTPIPTIDAFATFNLREVDVVLHLVAKTATALASLRDAAEAACVFQRGVIAGYTVISIGAGTVGTAETNSSTTTWYLPLTFTLTYRR